LLVGLDGISACLYNHQSSVQFACKRNGNNLVDKNSRFNHYTQLLTDVDAMFSQVTHRHQGQFQCQSGCFGCCQAGLTVSNVEAARISEWLRDNGATLAKIRDRSHMLDHPDYCGLLDVDGRCLIYPVRPLICRSHGLPVSWEESPGEPAFDVDDHASYTLTNDPGSSSSETNSGDGVCVDEPRDVCPLNFEGIDLGTLAVSDVLSLEKLNVLLSLINIQFDLAQSGKRVALMDLIEGEP
jgi:uncharacterized protein